MSEERPPVNQADRIVTLQEVDGLLAEGLLTPDVAERAAEIITGPAPLNHWLGYCRAALFGLGALQILTSVIFFFAANWSLLNKWERMVPIAGLLICCGLVSWLRHGTLIGRLFLTAAMVLVGVFMAVFGQIYQTGADAWTLFASWAALTVLWVIISQFWPLILLWLAVFQVAVFLCMEQVIGAEPHDTALVCALFIISAIGLLQWRISSVPRWFLRVLTVNAAMMLTPVVIESDIGLLLTTALVLVVLVGWYRRAITDLFIPAVSLGLGILVLNRVLVSDFGIRDVFAIGLFGAIEVALAAAWLRRQWVKRCAS